MLLMWICISSCFLATFVERMGDISRFGAAGRARWALSKNLRLYGLEASGRTPSNGNCFYHAIIQQCRLNQIQEEATTDHLAVRAAVAAYLQVK